MLCEGWTQTNQPVRLLLHHVNYAGSLLALSVTLVNPSPLPVQVQVIAAVAGPSEQESEVGHLAAMTFINRLTRNDGYIATIPPTSAITIVRTIFPQHHTVSGLVQLQVLSPGQLTVRVSAQYPGQGGGVMPAADFPPSAVFGDYEYLTTHIFYQGRYLVGDNWLFMPLGEVAVPAVRPGQNLGGSYGVTHEYEMTAQNLTAHTAIIVLMVDAAGGPGRLAYSLGYSWQETDVLRPMRTVTLLRFTLPPQQSRTIHLRAIPESASNYPMRFILRAE